MNAEKEPELPENHFITIERTQKDQRIQTLQGSHGLFNRNSTLEDIRMLSNKKFFNVSGHRGALRLTGVFSKKTARGLNEKEVEPVGDDRISCPADILAYETSLPWQRIKIS